ncbi:MAG TPA: S8 family peptidase, partial [Chitinophagaceae bacterium]|nr:S8 family peptidase [Chitinophagaceae bacterium]
SSGNQIRIHKGEYLHNLGFTGQPIIISILDAGFLAYKTNPALDSVRQQGRILGEWDYVANHASVNEDNSHGANCFTIIAANRPGVIVGSAPHSRFWLLRTENAASEYPVEEQNWAAAAEFSDSAGADMISSSLGYADFDDPSFDHSYAQRDGNTSIVTRAADLAAKKGIIVMNSAGNSGNSGSDLRYVACPADGDSVVAVGAVDANGNIASFSSWGPNGAGKLKPNMVSVGQGTIYANTAGNAVAGNGTSYSNPNLAGLIACFWQAFPELNNMQLIDAVQRSSHKFNNPDARFGYGIPDFKKAFITVLQQRATVSATANNCTGIVSWESKDNNTMQYRVQRKLATDADFVTIATVSGKSAAFEKNSYSYNDTLQHFNGEVQYRLLQVIPDTAVAIGAATVNLNGPCTDVTAAALTVSVAPNPVENNILYLRISTPEALPDLYVVIRDMKGRLIRNIRRSAAPGTTTQSIGLDHIAAGVYVVSVYSNNKEIYSNQIIKR